MFQSVNNKIMLSDMPYKIGKKLVLVYIPAASSLYFGLGKIWGFPAIENITGSLALMAVFIGTCLGISSKSYDQSGAAHDGEAVVTVNPETGKKNISLDLNDDPRNIDQKDSISFKVVSKEEQADIETEDVSLSNEPPKPPRPPKPRSRKPRPDPSDPQG